MPDPGRNAAMPAAGWWPRSSRATGRVAWRGLLDDTGLAAEMAASQVMVVPSDYEGFGIVYAEGMAFGLPAIATTGGTTTRTTFAITRGATAAAAVVGFRLGGHGLLVAAQHLALEHPHLDADDTVGCLGFRRAVIDFGA